MNNEVKADIGAALADRDKACPYLFQRGGDQIKGFRKAWDSACIGKILHFFKQSMGKETRKGLSAIA